MVARTQVIRFTPDRAPNPKKVRIGYEGDHIVERLVLVLPTVNASQTGFLMRTGDQPDIAKLTLGEDGRYYVDLTAGIIGAEGTVECYVRIDGSGGETWQSGLLKLIVGDVPDVEVDVEREYPTAVGQMLGAMAEHDAAMTEQGKNIESNADDARSAATSAKRNADAASGYAQTAELAKETAVEQAGLAVNSASAAHESDRSAQESAAGANESRNGAVTAAAEASASAASAAESATNAAQSAAFAWKAEANVQDAKSAAEAAAAAAAGSEGSVAANAAAAVTAAQSAAISEANAANSARLAENAASSAGESQIEAANHAANAQSAAVLSVSSASSSSNNASAAQASANAAAASASEACAAADRAEAAQDAAEMIPPERLTCFKQSKNMFTGWVHDGYYVSQFDGKLYASEAHAASDYIAVKPNTSYVFSTEAGSDLAVRYAVYNKSKEYISGGFRVSGAFETPEETAYIVISYDGKRNKAQLEEGTTATDYEELYIPYFGWEYISVRNPNNPKPHVERAFASKTDPYPTCTMKAYPNSIKQNRVISFSMNAGAFNRVDIYFKDTSGTDIIKVTIKPTEVDVYNYIWGTPTEYTYKHGLTITDHMGVKLVVSMDKCSLAVSSNGSTFKQEWATLNRGLTYPFIQIAGVSGTSNYAGSWTCTDFEKKTWVYGDSYIQNDATRWMYHLIKDGYNKNCLIDGYSGAGSNGAMTSLKNTLALGYVPKYIFWTMGMNDGTDANGVPSTTWMNNINELMAICEDYNIRPVLATIPSVPGSDGSGINHEAKNAWVRASGHQYVDFAAAVNATPEGAWLPGMLSSDNVHPAAPGGLALYHRVLSDFPQIMIG